MNPLSKISQVIIFSISAISASVFADQGQIDKLRDKVPELFSYEKFQGKSTIRMDSNTPPVRWLETEIENFPPNGECSLEWRGNVLAVVRKGVVVKSIQVHLEGAKKQDIHQLIWSRVVYMLISSKNSGTVTGLIDGFKDGRISEEIFLKNYMKVEFDHVKLIVDFYTKIWRPWAIKEGALPLNEKYWYVHSDLRSYDQWFSQQKKNGNFQRVKLWAQSLKN